MSDYADSQEETGQSMAETFSIDIKGDELNDKLGGGVPVSTVSLIEAPNNIGKSILAQRYAWGLLSNKHSVTYISTELSLMSFIKQMKSLRYDIRPNLMDGSLMFVSIFPSFGKVQLSERLLDRMLESTDLFQSDVIIIDTISYLLVKDDANLQKCFYTMNQLKKATGKNKSVVVCVDSDHLNKKLLEMLRSLSDVYMKMEVKEQYGTFVKLLHTMRINGAASEIETPIGFNVRAGIGIVVEVASLA